MSNYALTQTIVTGSDPRALPEFSAIREEINKANHPSQPELNWKLVESLALSIFKANGVDLHTATYYTLARTRNQGLAGFCEGAELLAADSGLGYLITMGGRLGRPDLVVLGMICVGLSGAVIGFIIDQVEKKLLAGIRR